MNSLHDMSAPVNLRMRRYRDEEDYWRIRSFLREVYTLNAQREWSWHVCRWDYWRWHVNANYEQLKLEDVVFIWETPAGQIGAVLNPEDRGQAFLQLHPWLHSPRLIDEMLALAGHELGAPGKDGRRWVRVWANEHDIALRDGLLRGGFHLTGWSECQRRQQLPAQPFAALPAPVGYTLRSLGSDDELPARSMVSWLAFHPEEPLENYGGWEWYRNIQRAPLYRRDLDLVAVAPDGELASFCTIWFDDVTRSGVFEPVGTAPAHQQRGVGKALMREGLRRLQALGATTARVGSTSTAAHALYASAGFREFDLLEQWSKELAG